MQKRISPARQLLTLFFSMMYISTFTFGGGFVIVTFMKRRFVDELHWITDQEMLDMTAIAQSSPGAIAVNAAILVGWHVAGFPGMLTAVLGTVIPPIVILLKGMQSGVAAVILDAACSLGKKALSENVWIHALIMAAAFAATFFFRINVIWIILASAIIGLILAFRHGKEEKS